MGAQDILARTQKSKQYHSREGSNCEREKKKKKEEVKCQRIDLSLSQNHWFGSFHGCDNKAACLAYGKRLDAAAAVWFEKKWSPIKSIIILSNKSEIEVTSTRNRCGH